MINNLKPYPAMKDSGVPWLGEVPEHWKVVPNRAIFLEVKICDKPYEEMLSVTITDGVIPQAMLLSEGSKKDSSNLDKTKYKLVHRGDIVYNKMRAWQGAIGVSKYRGIVSPAYVVQRPRIFANSLYFHYLYRTPSFVKEAERWSYGIASDMWCLRPEHFKLLYVCLPPLSEQASIVRYLDYIDQRVKRYVSAKERLIKLLEEEKQAIIHRAVTRGLDPNVRLKPSGVEWLGDIPEHWEVKRFKCIASGFNNGSAAQQLLSGESEYRVSRIETISNGKINYDKVGFLEKNSVNTSFYLECDDFLISHINSYERVGNSARYKGEAPLIHGMNLIRVRPKKREVEPEYLEFLLKTNVFTAQMKRLCKPAINQVSVTTSAIKSILLSIPPLPEQTTIVEYLDKATVKVDTLIDRARRGIELLKEYHTRLIADVVTGKVDVREVAARLPDEEGEA